MPYGLTEGPFEHLSHVDWNEIQETARQFPNLHLVRGPHEETVPRFADSRIPLAFILMDSDYYLSHRVSLAHLCPLLIPGGIILFHDWTFDDVQKAVKESLKLDDYDMMEGIEMNGMAALRKRRAQ